MISKKIFPLSDTLQIIIDVYRRGTADYELRGFRNFVLPLSKFSDLQLKTKIEASYVGDNDSAILVQMSKDFWIYLTYEAQETKEGTLNLYYLSFENQNVKSIKKAVDGMAIEVGLMAIRPCIKAKYTKTTAAIDWVEVNIQPKLVRVKAALA